MYRFVSILSALFLALVSAGPAAAAKPEVLSIVAKTLEICLENLEQPRAMAKAAKGLGYANIHTEGGLEYYLVKNRVVFGKSQTNGRKGYCYIHGSRMSEAEATAILAPAVKGAKQIVIQQRNVVRAWTRNIGGQTYVLGVLDWIELPLINGHAILIEKARR